MSFKDIQGQDKPVSILKRHIEQSRLSHAYLFVGPEGVGKKLVAKTLVKSLNCQKESQDACDNCTSCLKIENNWHPDFHIISTEGSGALKIEYIRQLQKEAFLKPYEGKTKAFIIDDAHNLTAEASNALLKVLEEPPKDCLIILISAKPALLFKTIISRCWVLKFYPLSRSYLEQILNKECHLDKNLARFLAYFCEGRLGEALKLKDTDILREKNRIIDEFSLLRDSGSNRLSLENRDDVRFYLNILASWFRDIYLIKTGLSHLELINFDRKTDILRLMPRFSFLDLEQIFNSLSDSLLYLEQNVNIKLLTSNLKMVLQRGL